MTDEQKTYQIEYESRCGITRRVPITSDNEGYIHETARALASHRLEAGAVSVHHFEDRSTVHWSSKAGDTEVYRVVEVIS